MHNDQLGKRAPLVVVTPCRDEQDGVEELVTSLDRWAQSEQATRRVRAVFVDDGSVDATADRLHRFCAEADSHCLQQAARLSQSPAGGLTAALALGVAATTEDDALIGFLDADCTYPPEILSRLAARVDAGADVALASPYHPDGGVEGVPGWRLGLSRGASSLWRWASGAPEIHTFTSMVRVWRRSVLLRCMPERGGFLGVTESLVRAARSGARIDEEPAVLRRRRTGQSKMRIARVAFGHLGMAAACLRGRLDEPLDTTAADRTAQVADVG
jgi:dolichol-phosphate mannosyltransferase